MKPRAKLSMNMKLQHCCLLFLLASAACKDEHEQIPGYVRVEKFSVNAQGGAAWQDITEGWFYANGELLGAYTLPAEIPVLASGETEVLVFVGVKENGIRLTPAVYPLLKRFTQKITLTPGETTIIRPVTSYESGVKFAWDTLRTTFDGNSSIVLENRDDDNATSFEVTSDGGFSGRCLLMEVDSTHPVMDVATDPRDELPATQAQPVWLELHYKNDMPFQLWIIGQTPGSAEEPRPVYEFNPKENWNKIYINLTQFLIDAKEQEFRLFFRLSLPRGADGKFSQKKGSVRLDNIRLVHL